MDRAADYVALRGQGLTVAQIARRRRRSKGYVSILLRLGQVLATLPPGEVAALRSPRITWVLAQRLIRADTPSAEVRAQLRYALGGFSSHNLDRRRRGLRRSASGDVVATSQTSEGSRPRTVSRPGESADRRSGTGVLAGWGFDGALFVGDPAAFVAAHLERLLAVHRAVHHRAQRETRLDAARRITAGQSLRRLTAALEHLSPPSPEQAAALRALAVFDAGLTAAVDGAVRELLPGGRPPRRARGSAGEAAARSTATDDRAGAPLPRPGAAYTSLPVSQAEIDEDLG